MIFSVAQSDGVHGEYIGKRALTPGVMLVGFHMPFSYAYSDGTDSVVKHVGVLSLR